MITMNGKYNKANIMVDQIDKHSPSGESTVSSTGSNACGDERLQFLTEQCSSMKQEFKSQNNALHIFA